MNSQSQLRAQHAELGTSSQRCAEAHVLHLANPFDPHAWADLSKLIGPLPARDTAEGSPAAKIPFARAPRIFFRLRLRLLLLGISSIVSRQQACLETIGTYEQEDAIEKWLLL